MLTFLTIFAMTILSGTAATLYYALRDLSLVSVEELATRRNLTKNVEPILADRDGHLLAVGGVRVIGSIGVTVSVLIGMKVFPTPTVGAEVAVDVVRLLEAIGITWVILYLMGLVIPLSLARHASARVVLASVDLIRALYILAWPVRALGFIDEAIRRLAGAEEVSQKEEIKEELLSVAVEGEREGSLGEGQRDMIEAVVEFGSTTAGEIMTPRPDIEAIELSDDLGKVIKLVREVSHSRIPVYEGTLDQIVGVFYVKDLMRWLAGDGVKGAGKPFRLRSVLRPALFVPESKPVRDLLKELIRQKVHIAMVADEYGGTAGVVTIEDIVEEVFGEIQDEYELPEDGPPEISVDEGARTAEADARATIYDANHALMPINIEIPEGNEYDTLGGFVMATLGHIPIAGETVEGEGFVATVLEAEPTRVLKLKIEARAAETEEEAKPAAEISAQPGK